MRVRWEILELERNEPPRRHPREADGAVDGRGGDGAAVAAAAAAAAASESDDDDDDEGDDEMRTTTGRPTCGTRRPRVDRSRSSTDHALP